MSVLPGAIAFKLYDTYGFPLDLTQQICRERGVEVDVEGFNCCMDSQRQRASGHLKRGSAPARSQETVERLMAIMDRLLAEAKEQRDIRPMLADFNRIYRRAHMADQGEFHLKWSER